MQPYLIELNRWTISNDGTNPAATTNGINAALEWASSQGIRHVVLSSGRYKLKINSSTFSCIVMKSNMHFEMAEGCVLELEATSSPYYRMFEVKGLKNVKISGGKIVGDKKFHIYDIPVKFERGGVNSDGSLNSNPNFIRSKVIDRFHHPGLLRNFRLWEIKDVPVKSYSFYQYKDVITSEALMGSRTNGQVAPADPNGRGWFGDINNSNKMIISIDISSVPLSDTQVANLTAKIDSQNYTHEFGQGIEIAGSSNVEIAHIEISDCTGDAVSTGYLQYRINPDDYTQEEMGAYIHIHHCDLHHCRRQGVTLGGSNDVIVEDNKIHHIGKSEDGISSDFRNGSAPMYGIDIESLVGETNIPFKYPYYNTPGLELNFRLTIKNNHVYSNQRGHFVNADGNYVTVENNIFEGSNVGGVNSYPTNMHVNYLNNRLIGTELWVEGDNFVNGVIGNQSNIKLTDCRGAVIQNVRLKDGIFHGNGSYGYLGAPVVNTETSTFSFANPHGMGNGAKVSFEEWMGKAPTAVSLNKIYFVVNRTENSFQVSETENGEPISIYDSGEYGFTLNRFNYGRCFISDIVVERDWNTGGSPGFFTILTGAVIKDVTLKNYSFDIKPFDNYLGRPNIVEGFHVVGAGGNIACSRLSNSTFMTDIPQDITLGSLKNPNIGVTAENCLFEKFGVNLIQAVMKNCTLRRGSTLYKSDNILSSIFTDSYMENSKIYLYWLTLKNGMVISNCTLCNVVKDINNNTAMINNQDISAYVPDQSAPIVNALPSGGIYNVQQQVSLTSNEQATIYFTLDGSNPTVGSQKYSKPILLSSSAAIKLIAVDIAGNQSKVKTLKYVIKTAAPANVTNLVATNIKNTSIDFSWDKSSTNDAVKYDLYLNGVFIGSTTVAAYKSSGLKAGSQYTFSVKAVDKAGNTSAGTSITIPTTNDTTPPVEVTNLIASSIVDTTIGLSWTKSVSQNVQSYLIFRDNKLIKETTDLHCVDEGLLQNTSYLFKVKVKDINGNESAGIELQASTTSVEPNFIKNNLVLYQKNPVSNTIIPNPDSYFIKNKPFTVFFTAKIPIYGELLKRHGGSGNKLRFTRSGNGRIQASLTAIDLNTGNFTYPSPISNIASDPNQYQHITIVRSESYLYIYENGIETARMGISANIVLNETNLPLILGSNLQGLSIKNFGYYDRALSKEEIVQNFNALD